MPGSILSSGEIGLGHSQKAEKGQTLKKEKETKKMAEKKAQDLVL